MEAAGWQVARQCRQPAVVVCGVGNNAGDGLAAARHLERWGWLVWVCCIDSSKLSGAAARELEALRRLGIEVLSELRFVGATAVVDAVFGTGLSRPPSGKYAEWIEGINSSGLYTVAVDVPSGLDAESGVAYAPIVNASLTVTLGLPKKGLAELGRPVVVADIGVPLDAYAAVGAKVPRDLFTKDDVVRL